MLFVHTSGINCVCACMGGFGVGGQYKELGK